MGEEEGVMNFHFQISGVKEEGSRMFKHEALNDIQKDEHAIFLLKHLIMERPHDSHNDREEDRRGEGTHQHSRVLENGTHLRLD